MKTSAIAMAAALAFLSVWISDARQLRAEDASTASTTGVLIKTVVTNSPAAQVGLKSGDRILAIDGVPTQDAFDMAWAISSHEPGSRLTLNVLRAGKTINIEGTLGRRAPRAVGPSIARPASTIRRLPETPIYQFTPGEINDQRAFGG